MVIRYLDVVGVAFAPSETDPPLVVHADTTLPLAITSELFEPTAGWNSQLFQRLRGIEDRKFPLRQALNGG